MRRTVGFLALGALALTAAILAWSRGDSRAPCRETPPDVAREIRWQQGAREAYRLETVAVARAHVPGTDATVPIEARLSGVLELEVEHADAGGARVRFRLAPQSYGQAGGPDRAREALLATPFHAVFDETGRPVRFEFPAPVPPEGRMVLEGIVRTFQVVTAPGDRWTAREECGLGRYVAGYRARPDGTLVKEKKSFEEVTARATGQPGPLTAEIVRSRATIRFRPGTSWVEGVSIDEEIRLLSNGAPVMDTTLKASLARIDDEAPVPDEAEGPVPATADPVADLGRLLEALDASDGASTAVVHGVRDLVSACPGTAERVVRALAEGSVGDRAAAALVNALELAGTPEAQAALGSILEGAAFGRMNRLRAAIALAGVAEPTAEALDGLWRTSGRRESREAIELADTSLLAFGSLAPRSPDAGAMEARLAGRLATAQDEDEAGILLGALGNTMDRALAPTVLPYLDAASPYVRASAADALGNMPGMATEARLVERLRVEEDARARTALAASLNRMEKPSLASLEAVQALVLGETDESTRLEMARFLGENLETNPAARQTLERLLRKDRSKRVRSCVGGVLLRSE